jgi:Protein of unknown function (DUF3000)
VRSPQDLFDNLLLALRTNKVRMEINWEEVPSPQRLAPFSFAATAEVTEQYFPGVSNSGPDGDDGFGGSGRFVLLYDPQGQDGWGGRFRIVTYIQVDIEPELASDPALIDLGWSWLKEALAQYQLSYFSESGTVTQIRSTSFGAIESRLDENELEIRASWTPLSHDGNPDLTQEEVVGHFNAWIEILSRASGLEPLPQGTLQLKR